MNADFSDFQEVFSMCIIHNNSQTGTSGDTGSAAIESVRGEKNMDIFVLLPHGLCSQVQELQMTTIEENVHVFLGE